MARPVEQIDDCRWRIPRQGGMRVEGRVYASQALMEALREDQALEQVANVAHLPGIVSASLAMPDIHWGYGFPIGGVAAMDAEDGVVSPGGVGFDINCLSGETSVLYPEGYTRSIREIVEDRVRTPIRAVDLETSRLRTASVVAGMARSPTGRVLEICTASGRRLVCTEDHLCLTPEGMREAGTLGAGARLAMLPFTGVEYEEPPRDVLVSEEQIREHAARFGIGERGNALTQVLRVLAPLLPLTYDHPALSVLLKVAGYVLGDGTVYVENGRRKLRVVVYGAKEDLQDMARDLEPWVQASPVHVRDRQHRIDTSYGEVAFAYREHSMRIGSTSLALLLAAMGLPVGRKTEQDWDLPGWLRDAPRWQKRLFLAGFFGAELTSPDAFRDRNYNFKCPVLNLVKRDRWVKSGRRFLGDLAALLREFGVTTLTVSDRHERDNPDGSGSIRLRLVISGRPEDLINLWSQVGYEYCRKRFEKACHAVQYLRQKQHALEARGRMLERICLLREQHGWGARKILAACGGEASGVNQRFVERAIYGRGARDVRTAQTFPMFDEWLASATEELDGGLVWDVVEAVEPRSNIDQVYDVTVDHPDHDFVASGFVVHNCGVRLMATELPRERVERKLADLVGALYDAVPTGVGAQRRRFRLDRKEMRRLLERGAAWPVERGMGEAEDLEFLEERGCLPDVDLEEVSERAVERGLNQLGTLGSGNHFAEVQVVSEVYDEEAAEVLGLRPGCVTLTIHCGSRGLGHQVCTDHVKRMQDASTRYGIELPDRQLCCAPIDSPEGRAYLGAMAAAANFAFANRQVISDSARDAFQRVLGLSPRELSMRVVYDVCHNIAKFEEVPVEGKDRRVLIHRKGATRAFPPHHPKTPEPYREVGQPVLIPGDMGRYSYVLIGTQRAFEETFGSTCHGAGRRLSRKAAKRQARGRDIVGELAARGIVVRATGRATVDEEMSEAYKDVADVVDVVERAGISRKVARLEPIGVIKG